MSTRPFAGTVAISQAQKVANRWFWCTLVIGLGLPSACALLYGLFLQFIPGFEPIGGDARALGFAELLDLMLIQGAMMAPTHVLLYLAFGAIALWYLKGNPLLLRKRKWIVAGGMIGLIGASVFFMLGTSGYFLGTEGDWLVSIMILANGIIGFVPGGLAAGLGAFLGYTIFRIARLDSGVQKVD